MATARGFFSGGGAQRGAYGVFSGLQDALEVLLGQAQKNEASKRIQDRDENLRQDQDLESRVKTGMLDPTEASKASPTRRDFTSLAPSHSQMLAQMAKPIADAGSFDKIPTTEDLIRNLAQLPNEPAPFSGLKQTDSPSQPDDQTGQPTLPSTQLTPGPSPDLASLIQQQGAKGNQLLAAIKPDTHAGFDPASGATFDQFVRNNPLKGGVMESVPGPQIQTKPSTDQQASIEARLRAATEQAGLTVQNDPANVAAGAGRVKANKQSELDVENDPTNVKAAARRSAAIAAATEQARQAALQAGMPPQIAASYVHSTSSQRGYIAFPPSTPKEYVVATLKSAQGAGLPVLTEKQADALHAIDQARGDLDDYMSALKGKLPQGAGGRVLAGPGNTIAALTQNDPQLAGLESQFAGKIQGLKAIAGALRVTQPEINTMVSGYPKITDDWPAAIGKAQTLLQQLQRAEDGVLGPSALPGDIPLPSRIGGR